MTAEKHHEGRHYHGDVIGVFVTDMMTYGIPPDKGRSPEANRGAGAGTVPAGGLASRSRAARASGPPALRPGREVLAGCGGWGGGTSAPYSLKPHETNGPKPHPRDEESLGEEPRWNADRRARPTADGPAQADPIRGARRIR